jgi:protein TonB
VVDAAHNCRLPEYPAVSRRMEEQGTVVLEMLIDVDGHVSDSKVANSSGHPRLDEAAREALSLCKFKPGTIDGKPEKSWWPIRYTWRLQ